MYFVKSALTTIPSDEKLGGLLGTTTKLHFPRKMNIRGQLEKSENKGRIIIIATLYFAVKGAYF